jgi:hypothetical protein
MLVSEFELHEICELPDNVFASAKHESVVLLGHKRKSVHRRLEPKSKARVVRVRKWDIKGFQQRYDASSEVVSQISLQSKPNYDFRVPELGCVWDYCEGFPLLEDVSDVGQGLIYKGKDLPAYAETISTKRFKGSIKGYAKFDSSIKLTETPKLFWLSLDPRVIRRPVRGTKTGTPQVLVNYAPVRQGPWRLMALIDYKGHPVTSRFLVIRPKGHAWSLEVLWGILNSPFVNAYIYTRSTKRDIVAGLMRQVPMPNCAPKAFVRLVDLVKDYFEFYSSKGKILQPDVDSKESKRRMYAIDAEVMRLYDLPPRLERQVLDLFDRWERPGVDFKFDRYYPEGFESWIPLHEYLSEEYQRSTPSFVNEWVKKNRSPEVIRALKAAVEAFEE